MKRRLWAVGFPIRALGLFLACAAGGPAAASPWVLPGDARLRQDLELLHAYGYLVGPSDAWPLPWAQILRAVERAEQAGPLPPHLASAVGRVRLLAEREGRRSRYEVRAAATNEAALVRTFERVARNPGEASVSAAHDLGALHIQWGATWVSDGTPGRPATLSGNGIGLEPSFAALKVGSNWALYGGWIDTWWGAGHDGAMLFSTSARPFPRVGFRRLEPFTIDAPLLRRLGPVTFDAFVGKADEERDFPGHAIIGIRAAFQPTPYFQIGLNRGLQLCGQNRPCNARTVGLALFGLFNADNTGTFDEPGNQLAGFDMSYRRPIGATGHVMKLHFATVAEDADNILIEQFARQIGAGTSGPLGRDGALYDAGIEYVETRGSKFLGRLFGGATYPGSIYNNFIYSDGWTYGRRPIGHSIDADSRMLTAHGALTDTRNRRWHLAVRALDLFFTEVPSAAGTPANRLTLNRERIGQVEAGVNWPTAVGDIRVAGRLQHNAPNTPDREPLLVQGEIGWTTRF